MKKIIIICLLFSPKFVISQDTKSLFEQAMNKLQAKEYKAGISLLDQVLIKNPKDYPSLFNRAVAKSIVRQYEAAFQDINKAIAIKADSKKAFLNRGIIRKKLTDYEGAQKDFEQALKIDPKYSDALYNLGVLYEYLGKYEAACVEFSKAAEAGSAAANPKVDFCQTPLNERVKTYSILRLEKTSTDKTFGFSSKNPVKVGTGPSGGTENEQTYLDLLRDETGASITYISKGKCCNYFTKNAPGGKGFLNQYEIQYQTRDGKPKTTKIYFTQFDFEEPQILNGFKTLMPLK